MKFQAAVNSLSTTSSAAQCIFIYPGTYAEQVHLPARAALLTIYGSTTDTTSYLSNTVTITQGRSQDDSANNDATATIRAFSAGLKIYNINIANTRGRGLGFGWVSCCWKLEFTSVVSRKRISGRGAELSRRQTRLLWGEVDRIPGLVYSYLCSRFLA